MSSLVLIGRPSATNVMAYSDTYRDWVVSPNCSFCAQRLPSEPIGTFTLTLTNVVVGSRVHVEKQSDGTSFYDELAATSTVVIPLSAYSSGSAYNALRIKVRKGTGSPTYKPFEALATAIVGAQSIYIGQIADE